jgi:L-malate glycosyltransferase
MRSDSGQSSGFKDRSIRATAARRHVLHVFASFGFGGVPLRVVNVINRLGSEFRHTILSLDSCYDSRARFSADALVTFAAYRQVKKGIVGSVRDAARCLRDEKPDNLATYNWGAIEWALANTLLVHGRHVHFESGFGPEEADRQIVRRVLTRRLALSGAACLVVPSRTLDHIARDVWRIRADKIRLIPNGVEADQFAMHRDAEAAAGFTKAPGELVVGTLAPLRREKNLDRLLQAFAALPDIGRPVRLLIAGDGGERAHLENLAKSLSIADRTVFVGHIEAVGEVLGLMDVFAISSDTEQMPNSLLQAMAAGCAVASVDVGDVGIMVAPENRPYVVPRDETGALCGAMVQLLRDDRLRLQTAHANFVHVRETYSMDRMLDAYRILYEGGVPDAQARPVRSETGGEA